MEYHVVTKGAAWSAVAGQKHVRLAAGDIVMFPMAMPMFCGAHRGSKRNGSTRTGSSPTGSTIDPYRSTASAVMGA